MNDEVEREDCEDIHQWVDEEPGGEEAIMHCLEFNGPVDNATNRNDQEAKLCKAPMNHWTTLAPTHIASVRSQRSKHQD